jgi:flagellar biosynthesis/type III secretory pathway protein FliH
MGNAMIDTPLEASEAPMAASAEPRSLQHAEVERLLAASRAATYSRSDGAPRKVKSAFAKTSLIDLARRASEQQHSATRPPEPMEDGALQETATSDLAVDTALTNESEADDAAANEDARHTNDAIAPDIMDNNTDGAEDDQSDADDIAKAAQALNKLAEESEEPISTEPDHTELEDNAPSGIESQARDLDDEASAVPPTQAVSETPQDAPSNDRDYEAGVADGRRAVEEEMRGAMAQLTEMVTKLSTTSSVDINQLSDELRLAVLALAAQRAGRAIDDLPEAFMTRIYDMVSMVDHATQNCTVTVNPEDFAVLSAMRDQYVELKDIRFKPDAALERGDVMVQAGAIELRDLLTERGSIDDAQRFAEIGSVMRNLIATDEKPESGPSTEGNPTDSPTDTPIETATANDQPATDEPVTDEPVNQ